jgi:3-oxoacyl-(acyl-carrier-protein) synthase
VLDRAGLSPAQVGRVWSSACGHPLADAAERRALGRALHDGGHRVETPKLALGEPIGAGGALNAVLALLAPRRENGIRRGPALVTSTSLGGTNVALLITE